MHVSKPVINKQPPLNRPPQLAKCGCCLHGHCQQTHLGIVMHFVLIFCVVMAFSSSSSCPVFFSFFTKLFTAFSDHFSSWPFCSPFFHPKSLFTMGGVKGRIDILSSVKVLPVSRSPSVRTKTRGQLALEAVQTADMKALLSCRK